MFNWLFGGKKEVEKLKTDVKESFDSVKDDLNSITEWIKHLDNKHSEHHSKFSGIHDRLASAEFELEHVKNTLAFINVGSPNV